MILFDDEAYFTQAEWDEIRTSHKWMGGTVKRDAPSAHAVYRGLPLIIIEPGSVAELFDSILGSLVARGDMTLEVAQEEFERLAPASYPFQQIVRDNHRARRAPMMIHAEFFDD